MSIHNKYTKSQRAFGWVGVGLFMSFSTANAAVVTMSGPFSTPDFFAQQNYVYSPLPEICTGANTTGSGGHCTALSPVGTLAGGLHKFVDGLPNLHVGPCRGTTSGTPNPIGPGGPYKPVTGAINNLGQCLSVATPDTVSFTAVNTTDLSGKAVNLPNSDYYSIELGEYNQVMHTDLADAPTPLRGYHQLPSGGPTGVTNATPGYSSEYQYLSPFIIAARNRPTRVKFKNSLQYEIPLPVDQSFWGAGSIDYNGNSTAAANPQLASTKRSNLHLHGGDTPWISDGTPHTWTSAANDASVGTGGSGYSKGVSFQNVPDMVTNGWLLAPNTCGAATGHSGECFAENTLDGMASYYYPNGQTSRLMFYHDHAFGITRLNVYQGEAAGYLLADKNQEDQLNNMGIPGFIHVNGTVNTGVIDLAGSDLAHLVPLVIQDKTFVPDNGQAGGQLALQDPTWPAPVNANDPVNYPTDYTGPNPYWLQAGGSQFDGWGRGSLWLPHVYVTNQLPFAVSMDTAGNPITPSTIAPIGRWDFTPWMGAPLQVNNPPVNCTTTAYPLAFTCPAMANPMAVPESFMDTIAVNGTVYPHVDLSPSAYRFKILNAADDRFFNMGLYIAVTQDPIVTITDTTPIPATPPVPGAIVPPGMGAMADVQVDANTGAVTSFLITDPGTNYPTSPIVTLAGSTGSGATAYATVDGLGNVVKLIPKDPGSGYTPGDTLTATLQGGVTAYGTYSFTGGTSVTGLTQITGAPVPVPANPVVVRLNYGIEPGAYTALLTSALNGNPLSEAKGLATVDITGAVIDLMADPLNPGANYIAGGTVCKDVPSNYMVLCTEVKQVYPQVYTSHTNPQLCSGANSLLPGMDNMGLVHVKDLSLGITGMSATCWPDTWPSDGSAHSGMVPDPTLAGPPIIQIGNEGGLLPNPVIIPSTPISYQYNRKVATVLGFTGGHGLDMAPAQRADIVVDFHAFAPPSKNTVFILYNDHPAPAPLFDSRYDMYTGDADQSPFGGAPTTLPGFGPNTRTLLQIRVSGTADNNAIDIAGIQSAVRGIPALFASTQDPIIVPQPNYPKNGLNPGIINPLGADGPNGYAPTTTAATFYTVQLPNIDSGVIGGINVTNGGQYTLPPNVTIDAPTGPLATKKTATATANLMTGPVNSLKLITPGSYTSTPTVTIGPPNVLGGVRATATANFPVTAVTGATIATPGSGYPNNLTGNLINYIKDGTKPAIPCAGCASIAYNVSSITVTAGGLYTAVPTVTIPPPPAGGTTATVGTVTLAPTSGIISVATSPTSSICLGNNGTGKIVTISGTGVAANNRATATAIVASGRVSSITVTAGGSGYTTGITATVAGCTGNIAGLTFTLGKPIATVPIANKGSGYSSSTLTIPAANITVPLNSKPATLTPVMANYVSSVSLSAIQSVLNTKATSSVLSLPSALTIPAGQTPGTVNITRVAAPITSLTLTNGGSGYYNSPSLTINGTLGLGTAIVNPRPIASFTLTAPNNGGSGYVTVPNVIVTSAAGETAAGGGKGGAYFNPVVVDYKGIIEGFDPIWGTLNVELGDSVPLPVAQGGSPVSQNYLVAAALPFGYVDPPSELVTDGGVADWRIDHIGVDAHALHFHLFNVQLINYLDIAGQIYMPDSNQQGWNEVLRTEPFTSAFVALRTKKMTLPWELPNSIRPMDPTTPLGTVNGPVACINNPFLLQALVGPTCVPFTQVDPTANAVNITNALVNYGAEYVYHCHLLSHEEHDMMRPISFVVAPVNVPLLSRSGTSLKLTDTTFNETDFIIEKSVSTVQGGAWLPILSFSTGNTGTTTGTSNAGPTFTVTGTITGTGVYNPTVYGATFGTVTISGTPVAPAANTVFRARAANIVGCNASVPALAGGSLPATAAPACSDIFTGWPSITAVSGPSIANGIQ